MSVGSSEFGVKVENTNTTGQVNVTDLTGIYHKK